MISDEKGSLNDSVLTLKDEIMEHEAYNLVLLNLCGSTLDRDVVNGVFCLVESGFLPKLRILDFYHCTLREDVTDLLYEWSRCFPFIDVLSPLLIRLLVLSSSA